jgi:hypothetical protein
MPPALQAVWNKLNANEKFVMYGAGVVVIAFLLGAVGGGLGSYASADIVAAIIVAVIYWLKYSPNKITWPAPVQTIVLVVAGISAIFALLAALYALSYIGSLWGIATIVNAVGCGMMAYGAWKEYQAMPKAATPPSSAPPTPPAA